MEKRFTGKDLSATFVGKMRDIIEFWILDFGFVRNRKLKI